MKKEFKIGFNREWAKSVSREKFIENHQHAYPDFDFGAEWDKINKADKPVLEKKEKHVS